MGNYKGATMPVDPKALEESIKRVGAVSEVAEQLGYKYGTFMGVFSRKRITRPMATMLDKIYGIKYEDYEPKNKAEETPEKKYSHEIKNPTERYLFMILQELKSINEYIGVVEKRKAMGK